MAANIPENQKKLFGELVEKAQLKQLVYRNTLEGFNQLKSAAEKMIDNYQQYCRSRKVDKPVPFELRTISDFQLELKFAGDLLLFSMHTNIFEFPRHHQVMRTSYVKQDKNRSYCGIINVYNFLADSFKYNRINDAGYLIGRIFVNKEMHYFIEGKRELGFLFNNFGSYTLNEEKAFEILEAAIAYTIRFDLLTPPYERVQEVSVQEVKSALDAISLKTGKRLGFKFQADQDME